jgi:hypothetical protein
MSLMLPLLHLDRTRCLVGLFSDDLLRRALGKKVLCFDLSLLFIDSGAELRLVKGKAGRILEHCIHLYTNKRYGRMVSSKNIS